MQGRRLPDHVDYSPLLEETIQNGDYCFLSGLPGWYMKSPQGEWTILREADGWHIQVHEDRTISVTPSIFFNYPHGWHGHLLKGAWIGV